MSQATSQKGAAHSRTGAGEGPPHRILIWGTGQGVLRISRLFEQYRRRGWRATAAWCTDGPVDLPDHIERLQSPPGPEKMHELEVDAMVCALPPGALRPVFPETIPVFEGKELVESWDHQIPVEFLDPQTARAGEPQSGSPAKRVLDLALTVPAAALMLPVLAILALAVKLETPGPAFFAQERIGWRGRTFRLWKLRSMVEDAENRGHSLTQPEDPRITRVGRFLRRWRLDELPQLWNVICGDMSLVGPRPEQPEVFEDFMRDLPFLESRLAVPPGVTGWAQVRYGYVSTPAEMREKFGYDLYYIRRGSLLLDLRILFLTVGVIFSGRGVR